MIQPENSFMSLPIRQATLIFSHRIETLGRFVRWVDDAMKLLTCLTSNFK